MYIHMTLILATYVCHYSHMYIYTCVTIADTRHGDLTHVRISYIYICICMYVYI